MDHSFDKKYWEQHWGNPSSSLDLEDYVAPPNPYVVTETQSLPHGRALDVGCGTGAESIWLAADGWHVTGVDISGNALAAAAKRAVELSVSDRVRWVEADVTVWNPVERWDLVVTNYAHSALPQLVLYQRIAEWVAPGGTLLIVGHLHDDADAHSEHNPPQEALVTLADISATLDSSAWIITTAEEHTRSLTAPGGRPVQLRDAVLRATRRR